MERLKNMIIEVSNEKLKDLKLMKRITHQSLHFEPVANGHIAVEIICPYQACRTAQRTRIEIPIPENPLQNFAPNLDAYGEHIKIHKSTKKK